MTTEEPPFGDNWSYEAMCEFLDKDLPLTMSLGLLSVLVRRMVREGFFREPVNGLVKVIREVAEKEYNDGNVSDR